MKRQGASSGRIKKKRETGQFFLKRLDSDKLE
jgi:hypothetical protein